MSSRRNEMNKIKPEDGLKNTEKTFDKHFYETKNSKKVSFVDEPSIIQETILDNQKMDTQIVTENQILNLKNIDEINDYCDKLITDIEKLIEKKLKKFDISGDIDDLRFKLNLLIQVKGKIIEENDIRKKEEILENYFKLIEIFFDNCEKIKLSDKKFDILLLFHQFELEDNEQILNYITEIYKSFPSTRFAIGYYYKTNCFPTTYRLCLRDFEKNEKFISREIKMNELQDEIVILTWKNSSKMVINIGKIKYSNEFLQSKSNTLFDKMDIICENYFIIREEFKEIKGISNFISNIFLKITNINYFKELYFLKRHQFTSFDEYLKEKQIKIYDAYLKFESKRAGFPILIKTCSLDTRNNFCISFNFDNGSCYAISFEPKTNEPSIHSYVKSGFYIQNITSYFFLTKYDKKYIWLEIIEKEESIMRLLEIHLTAKFYIDKFNSLLHENKTRIPFSVNISKVGLGHYNEILFFANFVGFDSRYLKIIKQDNVTRDMIDAIAHYSYTFTNGALIIFDLRPIRFDSTILITEPIIFSTIPNKYSSSDLGLKGIEQFKTNHKCNKICNNLNLSTMV